MEFTKIINDISKMDKSELLKRYWIDRLKTNLYMSDYFLEKFYELELYWINCKFEDRWSDIMYMKINDEFVFWCYDDKYKDEYIRFLQWLLYSEKRLKNKKENEELKEKNENLNTIYNKIAELYDMIEEWEIDYWTIDWTSFILEELANIQNYAK